MHRHAGHLANLLFREGVERRTGDGEVVALNNGELVDLHLQLLTGATHQDPLLLQGANQLQNAADVVDGGATDLLGALHHNLRPDTVAGEQLLQQGTVFLVADQVAAAHAAAAGFDGAAQETHGARVVIPLFLKRFDPRLGFVRKQLRDDIPQLVSDAL
ncbi:hypothetical protein D3C76_1322700 [compost metagenome]